MKIALTEERLLTLKGAIARSLNTNHPNALNDANNMIQLHDDAQSSSLTAFQAHTFYERKKLILRLAQEMNVDLCAVPSDGERYVEKIKCLDFNFVEETFKWHFNIGMVMCVPHEIINRILFRIQNSSKWAPLPIQLIRSKIVPKYSGSGDDFQIHFTCSMHYCVIYYSSTENTCHILYPTIKIDYSWDIMDDSSDDNELDDGKQPIEGRSLSAEEWHEVKKMCANRYGTHEIVEHKMPATTRKWSSVWVCTTAVDISNGIPILQIQPSSIRPHDLAKIWHILNSVAKTEKIPRFNQISDDVLQRFNTIYNQSMEVDNDDDKIVLDANINALLLQRQMYEYTTRPCKRISREFQFLRKRRSEGIMQRRNEIRKKLGPKRLRYGRLTRRSLKKNVIIPTSLQVIIKTCI